MSRRKTHRRLEGTRIYQKKQRYYYLAPEPAINPGSGKTARWHSLCPITDGEKRALALARVIIDYNSRSGPGDFALQMRKYLTAIIDKREASRPGDPARQKMFDAATKEIKRICCKLADAFAQFNVSQVDPVDVAEYVDQWEGQRTAQVFLSRMSDFMTWCARRGIRSDNPCQFVKVEKPGTRKRYMTDEEFHAIRARLAPMACCYVDLCYLLYQRATDIRLLRWQQIEAGGIRFLPTKTETSSGARVLVPLTPAIQEVLDRAKVAGVNGSPYVIHTPQGTPYTTTGIWSAWRRARMEMAAADETMKVGDLTLKDIRAKAATDAENAGYELKQISVGLAHTDIDQTEDYIKRRQTPISEVIMRLPKRQEK